MPSFSRYTSKTWAWTGAFRRGGSIEPLQVYRTEDGLLPDEVQIAIHETLEKQLWRRGYAKTIFDFGRGKPLPQRP